MGKCANGSVFAEMIFRDTFHVGNVITGLLRYHGVLQVYTEYAKEFQLFWIKMLE